MRYCLLAGLLAVLPGGQASAESVLAGDELRRAIAGRTVVLDTPVGGVPINYRANGTLLGKASMIQAFTGPPADQGRWWIVANSVCQQWNAWLDGRKYCYQMRIKGSTVHWRRSDGRTGTARIVGN